MMTVAMMMIKIIKLQDVIGAGRYILVGLVDGRQHVTVAGDFLLIAVAGFDLLLDNSLQPFVGCIDTFNTVGSVGALNLCHLQQSGQDIRLGFNKQLLAAPALMKAGQKGNNLRSEESFGTIDEIKFVHSAFGLPGKYSFFLHQKPIICIKSLKLMQKTHRMRQITESNHTCRSVSQPL